MVWFVFVDGVWKRREMDVCWDVVFVCIWNDEDDVCCLLRRVD